METFMPDIGDTVEFWNSQDELWETGDIVAYGADRRIYFIQPNDENLLECLVNYTSIRPLRQRDIASPDTIALVARLRDERDEANDQIRKTVKYWTETYCEIANEKEKAEAKADEYREAWQGAETAFRDQLTMRRQAEDRVGALESDLADVRSMARDLVEELDEVRDRAEKAEADLSNLRTKVIELRKATLSEMTRTAAEDGTADTVDEFSENTRVPKAVIDGQGDRWNHLGDGTYAFQGEYGTSFGSIEEIENYYGIRERIY